MSAPVAPYRRPRGARPMAALAAAIVTALILHQLGAAPPWHRSPADRPAPPPLMLRLLPAPAARPAPPEAPARADRRPLPRRTPAAQPITLSPAATVPAAPPVAAAPPTPTASAPPAPLKLGPDVIRQAARDSLSQTRQLAAQAGQPLDDAPISGAQRLADNVQQAGKPDCLAPNAGGSLLSLPIIALQALRQKCR